MPLRMPAAARRHWATAGLALAVLYAAVTGVYRAAHRPFDFDELATVAVVGDGRAATIWRALAGAADANPPTFYMIQALGNRVVPDPHVGLRLPTILGFIGVAIALFVLVGGRCGRYAGLAAALVTFATPLFTFYALEARPYTLLACALAWAWVVWPDAETRGRASLLAVLLAAATALHYYAVFSLIPFALGELTRTIRRGEVRGRVWLALAAGVMPLVAFWPLLSQFNQQYGSTFWARPQLLTPYVDLVGVTERWAGPVVVLLVAAAAASALRPRVGLPPARVAVALEDWVVALAFIALPVFIYAAAIAIGGAVVSRYAIAVIPAMAAVAAMVAFSTAGRRGVTWLVGAALLLVAVQQLDHWRFGSVSPRFTADHGDVRRLNALVRRSQISGLPVVVSNGLRYLPMAYYAGPGDVPFVYVTDPDAALRAIGTDSADRALAGLAPYLPIRLQHRSSFVAGHDRFLLFSENEYWDWLPMRLAADGHALRLLALDTSGGTNHMLFLVERPPGSSPPAD